MADDAVIDTDAVDGGPSSTYSSFVVMEDLLDKLKLLNYDKEFVRGLRKKALNR